MYIDPSGKAIYYLDRDWRSAPVGIEWDLTNRCDLGCSFCHFAYTHTRGPLANKREKPKGDIPGGDIADTDMVFRALRQAAEMGVQSVTWTGGGEPTLHPDFDRIIECGAALGLKQGLYTHGGHLSPWRASLLKQHLAWLVISLDNQDAEAYHQYKGVAPERYGRVLNSIKSMSQMAGEAVIGVSFLTTKDNWPYLDRMREAALENGASYAQFRPMILYDMANPSKLAEDTGWIAEALPDLIRVSDLPGVECDVSRFVEYQHWRQRGYGVCYGIRHSTVVTPNGKMWVCVNRREFPDSCLGDLSYESMQSIWLRHPGEWNDFEKCRVSCRLHRVNQVMWSAVQRPVHAEFV